MYAANVNGQRLTFHAEAVWRRNMIIRDEETGTLWQHATGEALAGPLQGTHLQLLGGERTHWASWKSEHPHSLVPVGPEKWPGLVPLATTERILEKATQSGKVPGLTPTDKRLPQNEEVIGISLNGHHKAYPLAILREKTAVHDQLGTASVTITYNAQTNRVHVTTGGQPLTFGREWWSSWYEFHPDTLIYEQ